MEPFVKNKDEAIKLRNKANELYKRKRFHDALVVYNQSLCRSEKGSEEMGLAFANRSAVYFEIKRYDKAISNIHKALKNKLPEKKKSDLEARRQKSEALLHSMTLKDENDPADFFKLSYKPNKRYPSFANCIEMRKNEKFGRHLITNRDLKPGDVIAIEDFFYYCVKTNSEVGQTSSEFIMNYQVCAYCLKDNLLDLDPCDQCVFTMYCSEECKSNEYEQFHYLECDLMPYFNIKPSCYNVFRSFFKALSICDRSIDALKELIDEVDDQKPLSIFDFDFSKLSEKERNKKLIQVMYSGCKKSNVHIVAAVKFIFTRNDQMAAMLYSHEDFIINFITRLYAIEGLNCFEFSKRYLKDNSDEIHQSICVGDCMLTGLTLLSHSCAPNVARMAYQKKFALVVLRKIKAGDQLLDCYGKEFLEEKRDERRAYLKNYQFDCHCVACVKDLPMLDEITKEGELISYASESYSKVHLMTADKTLTPTLAKKFLQEYLRVINENFKGGEFTKDFELLKESVYICLCTIIFHAEKIP